MSRRQEICDLLRERGAAMEIAEIADILDIHANTVRFHLETLVANGQVERTTATDNRPGRPAQLFAAVRTMDPTGPRNYRVLAEILAAAMAADPTLEAAEAGRRWGQHQAGERTRTTDAVDDLMHALGDLDFAPELHEGDTLPVIGLRHCPFLDLADDGSDVVCPVHLGLMRGLLEAWGSTITVDRLEAFAQPDLCTAHLGGTR